MTPEGQVDYFCSVDWGKVYEDDKYFEDAHLYDHFIVFYTYAFAHLNLPRPTRSQYEMALFIMNKENPHRMVMAMRGLSKSLTSQIYVVWRLLNDPDEHILVMSAGRTRAINYSQFVQKVIKMLPVTKMMSPRHGMERTSGESFDVAGSAASDSPSVYAVGAATQVTGFRATLIIYDDIETAQTVESVVKTEAINVYAMEAQNLLMSGHDESITLCTPHSINSIYVDWIEDKGFKLIILGTCNYDDINSIISNNDLTEIDTKNIDCRGMQDASSMIDVYRDSFCLVHPTYIDNSPNSVCEAQLSGLPVIATDVGGVSEVVVDGKSGFLVPVRDKNALYEKIYLLLSTPSLRRRFSIEAKRIYQEKFLPERSFPYFWERVLE